MNRLRERERETFSKAYFVDQIAELRNDLNECFAMICNSSTQSCSCVKEGSFHEMSRIMWSSASVSMTEAQFSSRYLGVTGHEERG